MKNQYLRRNQKVSTLYLILYSAEPIAQSLAIPNKLTEPCFAVVHLSGTQYKVHPGAVVFTEKLTGAEVGASIHRP